MKLWKCVFTSTQTFKTITAFSVPKFAVGLSCHWCRFLYFAGVVCRSSPIHSSHVAVSRPCRLSEFTPNRVSSFRWIKEQFSREYHVVCNGKTTTQAKNVYCYLPLSRDSAFSSLMRFASCRSIYLFRCYCWSTTYYRFTAGKLNMILLFKSQAVKRLLKQPFNSGVWILMELSHGILSYFGRVQNYP